MPTGIPDKQPLIDEKIAALLPDLAKEIEETAARYLDEIDAETMTAMDVDNVKLLAQMVVAAKRQSLAAAIRADSFTPSQQKSVNESVRAMSNESRQLSAALGIDRKSRMSGDQSELEMTLPKIYADAKEFIYSHSIAICCLKCRNLQSQVDIRSGILLYHFFDEDKEWSATFQCQREECGDTFTINHENWKEYRMDVIDEIVPDDDDTEKEDEF